jgi:small subunit ribosomal protein S1
MPQQPKGNDAPKPGKGESFASLFEGEASRTPQRRSFSVGEELDVIVVQVGRDALFVELDGKQEGFIEAKELTNKSGELTAKVGSRITARIVEIGGRMGAVRLTPVLVRPPASEELEAQPVPVEGAAASGAITVGAKVRGTVAQVERYGVFLQLGAAVPGKRTIRGLVPTAELGVPRGADLHKQFPLGIELDAKVMAIDERGRINLSIVALNADAERREFEQHKSKGTSRGETSTRGFGTLGDLLRKK